MKTFLLLLLFSTLSWHATSQEFHLRITGQTSEETKMIDSLKYNTKHKNIKLITEEINTLSANLYKIGYLHNIASETSKINDSIYDAKITLGQRVKTIHLYIGVDKLLHSLTSIAPKNNKIEIPYTELDFFLNESIKKLEQDGYALAKLKLINIEIKNDNLYRCDLVFNDQAEIYAGANRGQKIGLKYDPVLKILSYNSYGEITDSGFYEPNRTEVKWYLKETGFEQAPTTPAKK